MKDTRLFGCRWERKKWDGAREAIMNVNKETNRL